MRQAKGYCKLPVQGMRLHIENGDEADRDGIVQVMPHPRTEGRCLLEIVLGGPRVESVTLDLSSAEADFLIGSIQMVRGLRK